MTAPTFQENVGVKLVYGAESTFGTQSGATGQYLRRVSSTLALAKDILASNEVRPDQEQNDVRHGARRVTGAIQGELSRTTYDDLIAAALRNTWSTNEVATAVLRPSFTIEQIHPTLDISEVFLGCRIADMSVSMQPGAVATIGFSVMGQNMTTASGAGSPVFASPVAAPTTGVMAGPNGSLSIDGVASTVVTGLDFTVTNNLSGPPVVGSNIVPEIFYGRRQVSGTVSAFFTDLTLLNAYLNETTIKISVTVTAPDSTTMSFHFNRVKLNGGAKTVGPDGGVIMAFPFQSLLATSIAGDADGSLVIERSA